MNEPVTTIIGNATADAELRHTQSGKPVANVTVASTPRWFDKQANEWKDGEPMFVQLSIWDQFGENVAGTITKGMRLIATGKLKMKAFKDREGNDRTALGMDVEGIGPELRYATAQVTRSTSGSHGGYNAPSSVANGQGDTWATPTAQPASQGGWSTPGSFDDSSPF